MRAGEADARRGRPGAGGGRRNRPGHGLWRPRRRLARHHGGGGVSTARPAPEPTIDSKPYWDGLKERRLLLQQCGDCGLIRHYPRPMCGACHSLEVCWIESSRQGRLYAWTEVHHP
ncbi:MAG: hypothetical protein F4X35_00470, partial [Alphaproteobacteria bacterium]|nr:hypothetical protein [Alphaproteobacteria bacterium]